MTVRNKHSNEIMGICGLHHKDNTKARAFYERQGGMLVDEVSVRIEDKTYQEVAYRFDR